MCIYCVIVLLVAPDRINRFPQNLLCLFLKTKKNIGGSTFRKYVLGLISGEGVFCSFKTKKGTMTAPRSEFILWKRKLQKKKDHHAQSVLVSITGKGSFGSSETKLDKRTAPRPILFTSKRRLYKQRQKSLKTLLGLITSEDVSSCSGTNQDKRTASGVRLFASEKENTGTKPQHQKLSRI